MIIYAYIDGYDAMDWAPYFKAAQSDIDYRPWPHWGDPKNISPDTECYAFVQAPPHGVLAKYNHIRAIFSAWAGIDHLTSDPDLPINIPIIRMSDASLQDGMAEYATMASLWFLRDMPRNQDNQSAMNWQAKTPKDAVDFRVGIMGYGALGQAVAKQLRNLNFPINTWSNSAKPMEDGITHYCGTNDLKEFLSNTDMVFGLLPDTSETTDLLNAETISWLPKGAAVTNAGRGNLIDLDALINALNTDHLSGAMLDVFKTEPLPAEHPAWTTKGLIITPHVAAVTKPKTSSDYLINCIRQLQKGEQPATVYSHQKGY